MDRNTLVGFSLVAAVLVFFYFINKPSKETIAEQKRIADSTMVAQDSFKKLTETKKVIIDSAQKVIADTQKAVAVLNVPQDFKAFLSGDTNLYEVESDFFKLKFEPKGGRIAYLELKKYKAFGGGPLILFDKEDGSYGYQITSNLYSSDLYFKYIGDKTTVTGKDSIEIKMVLKLTDTKYIEHRYLITGNSYLIGHQINLVGFDSIIPANLSYLDLKWSTGIRIIERKINSKQTMIGNSPTIYYRYAADKPDRLPDNKDSKEEIRGDIQWIAFKQHFFTQTLINKDNFFRAQLQSTSFKDGKYLKRLDATMTLLYDHKPNKSYNLAFYFGPNHYKTLKSFNLKLEDQVFLGKNIIRWINTIVVIPVFNFLSKFDFNYGIIILLLTLIIKIILLPLTYKSYLSTAKMKLLKPEIDLLKEKFGKEAAKLQTETMKLYRSAGVSPLGGCLPMLLQMPILIALFRFFPSSIELRQESFLWATDLSTYDSIWNFKNGFSIPFYGDHVSLFTILMTISTLIYTRMNSKMMGGTDATAKQMQIIQYIMPVMFLGFFNNYSAGLSYYYFLANVITFGQQYIFQLSVNESKLRAKIESNKKKKSGTKSKWQQRLDDLQKQQKQRTQIKK